VTESSQPGGRHRLNKPHKQAMSRHASDESSDTGRRSFSHVVYLWWNAFLEVIHIRKYDQ
jgi:hypothetical protein